MVEMVLHVVEGRRVAHARCALRADSSFRSWTPRLNILTRQQNHLELLVTIQETTCIAEGAISFTLPVSSVGLGRPKRNKRSATTTRCLRFLVDNGSSTQLRDQLLTKSQLARRQQLPSATGIRG
ncbi:hypothetical protein PMIN06_000942 [Paraphaeosphaeria minitans]